MTMTTVLLPGVDEHGSGFRVRVRFGNGARIIEIHPSADAANARLLELRRLRDAGLTPALAPVEQTLAEAVAALRTRKQTTVSRKTRRPLRARTLEWWQRITEPWLAEPYGSLPVSLLSRNAVEDYVLARAVEAAKSAGDELYGLKAVLRLARERGSRIDERILALEPVTRETRTRLALDVHELELLAACAPDYARRFLLFKGTVGCRINELFTLTVDCVDLPGGAIFIAAEFAKEGVEKWIELTREEVALLREQLLARAAGSPLVFPTRTGLPWRHYQFLRLVWYKARSRAAVCWRAEHGLAGDAPTPFDGLQPHDLRATAVTLMRDAGIPREDAAARIGHADSGELLERIYDQGDRRRRVRRALDTRAPYGLRASLAEGEARPSMTSGALRSRGEATGRRRP